MTNHRLRAGMTTGSCAALAAKAATSLLLSGAAPETATITVPGGGAVSARVLHAENVSGTARCAVEKDAGDDPDVTDGMLVYASVRKSRTPGVSIDGGDGIGRVTKKGLDQPVGAAAINRVPRRMIRDAVESMCKQHAYAGGADVVVSIPGGEEMAARTFNPRLGIVGGLSVLGTTGIVEPMSSQALIDTIAVELRVVRAEGRDAVIVTPGNFGGALVKSLPQCAGQPVVKIANFVGDALDAAGEAGFRQVLLVGHAGKMIKLAGGIFDTHSRHADCRLELLALHAGLAGAGAACMRMLLASATVEHGLDLLVTAGMVRPVMDGLLLAMEERVAFRVAGRYAFGIIVFDNRHGILAQTAGADEMLKEWHGG